MKHLYTYKAIDVAGRHSEGTLEAQSEAEVKGKLLASGLAPLKLTKLAVAQSPSSAKSASAAAAKTGNTKTAAKPSRVNWKSYFEKKLPTGELILFTKQFKTLYTAGITLDDIFRILAEQTSHKGFARVIEDMRQRVTQGEGLQASFLAHKNVFSPLYCAMIGAGEESGALPEVLDRLTYIIEHEESTKQKIASATRYPKMVVGVMAGAFLILLNVVIPQFASLYARAKVELPLPTQIAIALNHFCQEWWWPLILAGFAVVVIWSRLMKTERGVLWRDTLALKIPVLGTVLQKAAIARFAAIMSILQRSGISIIDSIGIVSGTINNAFFSNKMDAVRSQIHAGESIAKALTDAGGFSPLALSLITVGENTGSMEEMLNELARHYDTEVSIAVDQMTDWIAPILIIALGAVVLFFALAIFLPMWDLVKFV